MKLIKRTDLTLFPIIFTIFFVCGLLVYSSLEQRTYSHYETIVKNSLQSGYKEASFEFNSIQKTLGLIQNSAEFVRYMNEKDTNYQAFSLNASVYALIERTLSDTNIHSFYVTDSQKSILLDYEKDGDPFTEASLKNMPTDFIERCFIEFEQSEKLLGHGSILYSQDRGYEAVYAKSTSARLLDHDKLATNTNGYIALFLVSKLEAIDHLTASLDRIFRSGYHFEFDEFLEREYTQKPTYEIKTLDGDIIGILKFSHYQLLLTIPKASIKADLQPLLQSILLTSMSAAVIGFALLRLLIVKQVVGPIAVLTRTIHQARQSTTIRLKPMVGDDEVSSLNNAYIELLDELHDLASFDNLTGLSNRRNFELRLNEIIEEAKTKNSATALLFIDLDNFKNVNDTYGHYTGDLLLKEFAKRMQEVIRSSDIATLITHKDAARLAGDEFAVVLGNVTNVEMAKSVGQRILDMFANDFVINHIHHNVRASIGIAITDNQHFNAEKLLRNADMAMYHAKSLGRNRLEVHNESLSKQLQTNSMIEAELNQALADDLFHLVLMPIYELNQRKIIGYETLIRCPNLQKYSIGPDQFIPVAEESNLIHQIDQWVIHRSLEQFQSLVKRGFDGFVSINFSALALRTDDFVDKVYGITKHFGLDSSRIHLEVTETGFVKPDKKSSSNLTKLRQYGFKVALDDFGTGYTAFNQLTHYPIDTIKIDRSFVSNHNDEKHRILIKTIMAIANVYGVTVIAEGIETEEQLLFLLENGCSRGQGYALCRPVSYEQFAEILTTSAFVKEKADGLIYS